MTVRIGMLAPITHPLPPEGYGPWERVVSDLTEALVAAGHRVTLFAAAGSETAAELVPTSPHPLASPAGAELDPRLTEQVHIAAAMERAAAGEFDILHSHLHAHALVFSRLIACPLLTTLHGAAWVPAIRSALRGFPEQPFVSLSDTERAWAPDLNYVATIPNGIDLDAFRPGAGGEALAFVGRLAPEKAPDLAVEVARAVGAPLRLAGPIEDAHRDYFEEEVRPHLHPGAVEYLGALSRTETAALLGESLGLLMPLRWDEPFGLVVAESLACGTPVVAWKRGAMAELVDPGLTGFLVDGVDEAAAAVGWIEDLDRRDCRRVAEDRFAVATMAQRYIEVYRSVVRAAGTIAARTSSTGTVANETP